MEELIKKLTQLLELTKALKDPNKPLVPTIPALPAIRPPSAPSIAPKANQTKMPGISPNSKKDPKKVAQQIKDGSMSTKTQKIMLKFDQNGQWSLDDVEKTQKPTNSKDPVLNNDKYAPKPISPEKQKEMSLKLESYLKNKSVKKDEVESPSDEEKASV